MPHEFAEQLDEAFTSVLEQLAFMFAEPTPKDEMPSTVDLPLEVDISFKGPTSGRLSLISSDDICHEMAVNILGIEDETGLAAEAAHDALKELLNVTCGQLLTKIAGERPIFDLSPPQVHEASDDLWTTALRDDQTISYVVDDNPVLLRLALS